MRSISLYITTLFACALPSMTTFAREPTSEVAPTSETEITPPPATASAPAEVHAAAEEPVVQAPPQRARVELSQTLGIVASGYVTTTGQTAIGYVISDHFVWQTGGGASLVDRRYGEGTAYKTRTWSAFTGLEVYTRAPRAGGFSPTFRLSVEYSGDTTRAQAGEDSGLTGSSRFTYHTLGGRASGGMTYFATDHLGVSFDVGLRASRVLSRLDTSSLGGDDARARTFGTSMNLSVLLRY